MSDLAGKGHIAPEIFEQILEQIIDGKGLREIYRMGGGMPAPSTVYAFLSHNADAAERYARAREYQADAFADEIIEIADRVQTGISIKRIAQSVEEAEDGGGEVVEVREGDMTEHRKMQIDARKWAAAKLAPKKYGPRSDLNVTGELTINTVADRLARAKAKVGSSGA